jgi:RNA polymerase sigma-70 factor (ECF subfamily)
LGAVCAVLHALYTSAHTASSGETVSDIDGCAEAVRLARLVQQLLPDEPMPMAVLALVLLTEARRPARTDATGEVVPMTAQDRSRWDAALIAEGERLLADSLRRTGAIADPYQLQAAIAAEHARANSYQGTDWPEIVRLYDLLLSVRPTSAAELARAVAVAEADGTAAGLAALNPLPHDSRWRAVRGELLARQGRWAEAIAETQASLDADLSTPERRYRERRIAEWSAH